MMSEVIERVARALWTSYRDGITANAEIPHWDDLSEHAKDTFRGKAVVAIETMRKPTEDMLSALDYYGMLDGDEREAWDETINAALHGFKRPS